MDFNRSIVTWGVSQKLAKPTKIERRSFKRDIVFLVATEAGETSLEEKVSRLFIRTLKKQ